MDDLGYLAEYAPECFEKTCQNVVYNIPETKPIMEPVEREVQEDEAKRMEMNDFPVADIDVDKVKSLLGNLYMELLFPHNDKDTFMNMANHGNTSSFDKKA